MAAAPVERLHANWWIEIRFFVLELVDAARPQPCTSLTARGRRGQRLLPDGGLAAMVGVS